MKNDFSNWYRTRFNQLDANPPKEIWENIANELDIEEVWTNVNFELKKKSRRKVILRNTSYLIMLLLLFGTGALFFYHQADSIKPTSIAQYPSNHSDNIIFNKKSHFSHLEVNNNDKKTAIHKNKAASNDPSEKIKIVEVSFANKISQRLNENQKQRKNTEHFSKEANSDLVDSKTITPAIHSEINQTVFDSIINPNSTSAVLSAMVPIQIHLLEKNDSVIGSIELIGLPNDSQSKCLIIGTAFTYSNSWLLNSDTYDGFNKNNLNQTNLSFGNSYAVVLGYDLSTKYTLQTEWLINDKQEQDYIRYYEGKQVQKKIEINYTHFNLLLKKKKIKSAFKNRIPASLNYLAGIEYGYIKSVYRTVNDKTRLVTNRYRKNNYSLILGVEYQLTIKQWWLISAGLRADIGARNIYAGNAIIPASFNRTYNSSIGLNVGINYIIPLKRKK